MKKAIFTVTSAVTLLLVLTAFYPGSEETFSPGYYIINSNAQYSVALPSGVDYYYDDKGCAHQYEILKMKAGEVVIAFELPKGKYHCFDPNGRMVVFQGSNCLTKAPITEGAGVGHLDETIDLIDGGSLDEGAYYWIISQDVANSTVKVQVADGKTYNLPQSKITFYGAFLKKLMKSQTYVNVED